MSDRDPFLRAIRERPDDDGPRLVYADWLEEQGDPRGEFIRIQCELAKLPPWHSSRPALEEREADLLAEHDDEWLGQPPRWVVDWSFKRGFVDEFAVTRPTLRKLDGLLAGTILPTVTFAVYENDTIGAEDRGHRERPRLTSSPHLDELGGLIWDAPLHDWRQLPDVFHARQLRGVRRFGFRGQGMEDSVLPILASRPGADLLGDLGLNGLSSAGADYLLHSKNLGNIESLRFAERVDASFVHGIGETPFRWRTLDLGQSQFRAAELAGLADCYNLTELYLTWVRDLTAPLPLPPNLKRLHLNWGEAGPLPPALPRLNGLSNLEWLYLRVDGNGSNPTNDAAALENTLLRLRGPVLHLVALSHGLTFRHLARMAGQDRFRRLVFHCEEASDTDVRELANCEGFSRLHSFHLRCPRLTPRHLEMLAEMPFPPSLRRLTINSPLADDDGLATLLSSPHLQRLTYINLRGCHPGRETLAVLAESPMLRRLRELILPYRDELDEQDHQAFRATAGLSPLFRIRT